MVKAVDESPFLQHMLYFAHVSHKVLVSAISSYDLGSIWDKVINLALSFNISSNRIHYYD